MSDHTQSLMISDSVFVLQLSDLNHVTDQVD